MAKKSQSTFCINSYCEVIGKYILKEILNRILMNARVAMVEVNTELGISLIGRAACRRLKRIYT